MDEPAALATGQCRDALAAEAAELDQVEHPQHLPVPGRGVGPLLEDGQVVEEVEGRAASRAAPPPGAGSRAGAAPRSAPRPSRSRRGRRRRWCRCSGGWAVASSLSRVDLPAPLGPSSPVTPVRRSRSVGRRARVAPYFFDTPRRLATTVMPGSSRVGGVPHRRSQHQRAGDRHEQGHGLAEGCGDLVDAGHRPGARRRRAPRPRPRPPTETTADQPGEQHQQDARRSRVPAAARPRTDDVDAPGPAPSAAPAAAAPRTATSVRSSATRSLLYGVALGQLADRVGRVVGARDQQGRQQRRDRQPRQLLTVVRQLGRHQGEARAAAATATAECDHEVGRRAQHHDVDLGHAQPPEQPGDAGRVRECGPRPAPGPRPGPGWPGPRGPRSSARQYGAALDVGLDGGLGDRVEPAGGVLARAGRARRATAFRGGVGHHSPPFGATRRPRSWALAARTRVFTVPCGRPSEPGGLLGREPVDHGGLDDGAQLGGEAAQGGAQVAVLDADQQLVLGALHGRGDVLDDLGAQRSRRPRRARSREISRRIAMPQIQPPTSPSPRYDAGGAPDRDEGVLQRVGDQVGVGGAALQAQLQPGGVPVEQLPQRRVVTWRDLPQQVGVGDVVSPHTLTVAQIGAGGLGRKGSVFG